MTTQVEARSLSALNHLAANPPSYPASAADKRESLTLYISRVPGARDIILSTFKPQRKNVTGDDVANALYYVHLGENLASPSQAAASADIVKAPATASVVGAQAQAQSDVQPLDQQRGHEIPSHMSSVVRKPLPNNAKVASAPPAATQSIASADRYKKNAHPLGGLEHVVPSSHITTSSPSAIKPLGPRPPPAKSEQVEQVHGSPAGAGRYSDNVSFIPATKTPQAFDADAADYTTAHTISPVQRVGASMQHPVQNAALKEPMTHLTTDQAISATNSLSDYSAHNLSLIRRDPSTGAQWNIGRIISTQTVSQTSESMSPPALHSSAGRAAIDINIDTSGYARFRDLPVSIKRRSGDVARPVSFAGNSSSPWRQSSPASSPSPSSANEVVFRRQVMMAYGKRWNKAISTVLKQKQQREGENEPQHAQAPGNEYPYLAPPNPRFRHERQNSTSSFSSVESIDSLTGAPNAQPKTVETDEPFMLEPGPGLREKGFVFSSPWDGRCEFRTSRSGRALKCRHVQVGAVNGGFNPLVAAQTLREGVSRTGRSRSSSLTTAIMGTISAPVSELRFNLPSADLFHSKEDRARAAKELHGHFNKLVARMSRDGSQLGNVEQSGSTGASALDDDDEPIFDFSRLGREKAGGGNRGKRAKLGKLIIHDEGLKMLDLVVAANVGIWWQVWEKTF